MSEEHPLRLVDAHFAGRIGPRDERVLRAHLVTCSTCRDHYERLLYLAAVDPVSTSSDKERLARGLGLSSAGDAATRPRWLAVALGVVPALVLCGAVVFATGHRSGPLGGAAFEARRAAPPAGQLLVYEVTRPGVVKPVASEIRADHGLAFAYANATHRHRLLVFAVDEHRRVYWYHPAWTNAADNPVAVRIASDDAVHELPQIVYQPLQGARLQLFGAFVDAELSVRDVEAAVARAPSDAAGRLAPALPGAELTRLDLRMARDR